MMPFFAVFGVIVISSLVLWFIASSLSGVIHNIEDLHNEKIIKENSDLACIKQIEIQIKNIDEKIINMKELFQLSKKQVKDSEVESVLEKQQYLLKYFFEYYDKYQACYLAIKWKLLIDESKSKLNESAIKTVNDIKNKISSEYAILRSRYAFISHLEIDDIYSRIESSLNSLIKVIIIEQTEKMISTESPIDRSYNLYFIKLTEASYTYNYETDLKNLNYEFDKFIAEIALSK